MNAEKITPGRMVEYTFAEAWRRNGALVRRPAMVIQVFTPELVAQHEGDRPGMSNLRVFTDRLNDKDKDGAPYPEDIGSAHYDPEGGPGTWRWPARA